MHKLIYGGILLVSLCLSVAGCNRSEIQKPNKQITERQDDFDAGGSTFAKIECPYGAKELNSILNMQEKEAWPKVRVTATFGVFPHCRGCQYCGCCVGLCIQIEKKSSLAYSPLTDAEIADKQVLFDFIDLTAKNQIVLIPKQNMDNGDGYLHVENGAGFSDEVNDYIGRKITLAEGSYEIVYSDGYPNGVAVISTL